MRLCRTHLAVLGALSLLSAPAAAQDKTQSTLPLKRLRLYETGVAYFERGGTLAGGRGTVPVPAGHLDDALKSLVVLAKSGSVSISGVEFGSSVSRPLARALAGLPNDESQPLDLMALLQSLKGAVAEVKSQKRQLRGRLVDVVSADQSKLESCVATLAATRAAQPCEPRKQASLLILSDKSELVRIPLVELESVRPTDTALAHRLDAAVSALAAHGAQTRRTLEVKGTPGQSVSVGYIAEAPVWRSSYRLVLDDTGRAKLQGWALLHNDTDEPWRQVSVDLVNGRPDSFLFPLAAPRYAHRELVTPEHDLATVPQLLDTTIDNMWGDAIGESMGAGGLGLSGVGEGGGGRGEGIGLGSIGTIGHGAGTGTSASNLISLGNIAGGADAQGVEAGALFRYALRKPIDLGAHGSVLVPFVEIELPARRLATFTAPGAVARTAVELTHAGQQTLPEGTVAVFADGGFAGESSLSRTKPNESRIVRFGADLDAEIESRSDSFDDETRAVRFDGDLVEHFARTHFQSYELVNKSTSPKTFLLKLKVVANSKLEGDARVVFDSGASAPSAAFEVPGRSRQNRSLKITEGLSRRIPKASLTSALLRKLAKSSTLSQSDKQHLLRAAERLLEAEVRKGGMTNRSDDLREIDAEIERLRRHLKAAGASRAKTPAQELTSRLLKSEDKGRDLRQRIGELAREIAAKQKLAYRELGQLGGAERKASASR